MIIFMMPPLMPIRRCRFAYFADIGRRRCRRLSIAAATMPDGLRDACFSREPLFAAAADAILPLVCYVTRRCFVYRLRRVRYLIFDARRLCRHF